MGRALVLSRFLGEHRWFGWIMALAVTLLLSVVPLKTPLVNLDLLDGRDSHAGYQAPLSSSPTGLSLSKADKTTLSALVAASTNAGAREQQVSFPLDPSRWLFAGIRGNASLPPHAVRLVALPAHYRQRLRSPPACA